VGTSLYIFFSSSSSNHCKAKMKYHRKVVQELKPASLMVLAQVATAAVNVLYKLAINDGMSIPVLTSYRHIFGAAFSLSLALVIERYMRSNPLSFFLIMMINN